MNPRVSSLRENLRDVDPDAFQAAVSAEIEARIRAFADGVNRFKEAPRLDRPSPLPDVWREGTTRLLHAASDGPAVMVIPSLVNRAHILDLSEKRSLIRFLQERGLDTYLVDWTAPGEDERTFAIDDYVDRLEQIRDVIAERNGPPMVVGYCMGGNLALALAHRDQAGLAKLALLATPWDFDAMPKAPTVMLSASLPSFRQLIAMLGVMPVDVLQAMFAALDPGGTIQKFREFGRMAENSPAAHAFVELEDWLNDGVPLAGPVALECLEDWYVANKPARGTWLSGGRPLIPEEIEVPTLAVVPEGDTIVPPASARPLAEALPKAELINARAGHIGMVAGSRAKRALYDPLATWLAKR